MKLSAKWVSKRPHQTTESKTDMTSHILHMTTQAKIGGRQEIQNYSRP